MTATDRVLAGTDRRKPLPDTCSAPGCDRRPRTRLDNQAVCGRHEYRYRRYRAFSLPALPIKPWHQCNVDGCSSLSRTRHGALCETHYHRRYRTGSFDDPRYKRRYISRGYVRLVGADCPIAGENGSIFEHRKVLFDAIGPGTHSCHWCSKPVTWGNGAKTKLSLVVDHLNSQKDDNRIENLVPACQPCNAARGLFMSWVMKHKDDPFLLDMFSNARNG